jgi:hypothetical protein
MWVSRKALAAVVVAWMCASGAGAVDFSGVDASSETRYVAQWVVDSRDNKGRPFVVVDKKDAKVFVFGPRGKLIGSAPALLGVAHGDQAFPGTGALPISRIPTAHRTTPAGRFETEAGVNLQGEDLLWLDYDAGLAIHRVRDDAARQVRLARLASGSPDAHRVSAGCIVLPVSFYENVVKPTLARGGGAVYVLPEMRPARELFKDRGADL